MERQFFILKAIIESFIQSAEPVGSKYLMDNYDLQVSSATIRNEMALLEKQGYLYQPYTSAGRVPTDHGFRVFVDQLMTPISTEALAAKQQAAQDIQNMRDDERLYQAVSLLSRSCGNVSFGTIFEEKRSYFLGLSNMLQQPEFERSAEAYTVVRILEDRDNFVGLLQSLDITDEVKVFIGEENILPEIRSCSMIAVQFTMESGKQGIIGILGPKRMNYAYNIGALETVKASL